MEVTLKEAYPLMMDALTAGLIPYLKGSPGLGKSDIMKKIAKDGNALYKDIRLAQCDPTDLNGFPRINEKTNRSGYAAPEDFPLEGDEIPNGYKGWLIAFDELSSASLAVQAASYKVFLDRKIGQQKLHKNVLLCAAGNLSTDRAVVNHMSTAMQSRLIHLKLKLDFDGWIEWANENKLDARVIGFLQFRPELLHRFDPKHEDDTFPCPRTWEFMSKLIKNIPTIIDSKLPIMAGTVGDGPALEFLSFSKIFNTLPTLQEIIASPKRIIIPTEPSILYALSSLLTSVTTKNNLQPLSIVINKLPLEFQTVYYRSILQVDRTFLQEPEMKQWVSMNADAL